MGGIILGGVPVKPQEEWLHWLGVIGHYLQVAGRKAD
jgi:hypothetical protein